MTRLPTEFVPAEGDRHDPRRKGPPRANASTASDPQKAASPPATRATRGDAPNIVLFGETGIGKSSLINMLAGDNVARTSGDALGCTFESQGYPVEVEGRSCTIWDTAGLDEGEHGSVPAHQGMRSLQDLVIKLEGGVSLLVYCVRGTRFRDILQINYDLFQRIIFQKNVPLVLIVTGLEHEERMESWWDENHQEFEMRGLQILDHACVAATKGKRMASGEHMFEGEYADSAVRVKALVAKNIPHRPWIPPPGWLRQITKDLGEYYEGEKEKSTTRAQGTHQDGNHSVNPLLYFFQLLYQLGSKLPWPTFDRADGMGDNARANRRDISSRETREAQRSYY